MGLPCRLRLRCRSDFKEVYARGQRYTHPLFIAYVLRRDGHHLRLGVSLSRHLGKAVARNRVRRRCQEALRRLHPHLRAGADVVLIPLPAAMAASQSSLGEALRRIMQRGGLWVEQGRPTSRRPAETPSRGGPPRNPHLTPGPLSGG